MVKMWVSGSSRSQYAAGMHRKASFSDHGAEAYSTPLFRKTRREELAEKWDNLGFSIRPMNGHVRPGEQSMLIMIAR